MKTFIQQRGGVRTEYRFVESNDLPGGVPISTPLTFAFIGKNVVLTKKRNGWWDILGGKVEEGETWIEGLVREAREEAGVLVDHISIVGYISAHNSGNQEEFKFPERNILPVTISFVQGVDQGWKQHETLGRESFVWRDARVAFSQREDNGQLGEIFEYVISCFERQGYEYVFEYKTGVGHGDLPNTQSMTFIKTQDNKFLVVRDLNEDFFSLPGGSCSLNETGIECALREVREEAQVEIDNLKLLGTVVVKIMKGGVQLSLSAQSRYLARVAVDRGFVPQKGGSEIIQRETVEFGLLKDRVMLLDNETGDQILADLKKKL